jgi:hypothetical protein
MLFMRHSNSAKQLQQQLITHAAECHVLLAAGMREISMEEWQATPVDYLRHPDLHPRLWSRAPGDAVYGNEREKLFSKHGRQDPDPSTPAGGHGHGHH